MFFSTISKLLPVSQFISLKNKFFYFVIIFVQVKAGCKFFDLCLIQHSAKVRPSALLAISSFLTSSQNVKKVVNFFFLKWRSESDLFATPKVLLESKDFGLDFPCNSSSFIFNSNCNFYFSISMRSSVSSLNFSCYIFSLSISICFFLSRSSISNL